MNKPDERRTTRLGGNGGNWYEFQLYGLGSPDQHDWLIIDLGITFGDDSTPGVDVIVPIPHLSKNAGKIYLALF